MALTPSPLPLAWVDAPTGLAGNMLLAALFDAGLPREVLAEPLARLGLEGAYRLELEERRSAGLRGLHLEVVAAQAQPSHRRWGELEQQIRSASLAPPLAERVLAVFALLAEAEAAVHGQRPEQVHFHEVGALDALVDVVGVCAGLLHFGVERLICSPPPAGHGSVLSAHGRLPVPAPAVLEIARRCAIPLAASADFPAAELTTPTGLALMAVWAEAFELPPALLPQRIGCGLGTHQLGRPNLLRLVLAQPDAADFAAGELEGALRQPLLVQQAQIDDASPEDLAFLITALGEAGALEVFSQPLLMKKGRQGSLITALLPPQRAAALRRIWWQHSTSLGLREQLEWRWRLPRQARILQTSLGPVRFKQAPRPGDPHSGKPEFEDLAALARRHGLSLQQLRRWLAAQAAEPMAQDQGAPADAPELPWQP
ncbi:MAG: nickel pincer cofactor biosynthesis protein LarC [Prochlorococcaceae cyanobacterium]